MNSIRRALDVAGNKPMIAEFAVAVLADFSLLSSSVSACVGALNELMQQAATLSSVQSNYN